MNFRFHCRTCGEDHVGMPALTATAPLYFYSVPDHPLAVEQRGGISQQRLAEICSAFLHG